MPADEPHDPQFDVVEEQPTLLRDDALRRAEAALFGFREPDQPAGGSEPSAPTGRILKNLAEVDPIAETIAADAEPRRRGRKPGSVNRPKLPEERERPKSADDTSARHVPLTPDIVDAALKAIEKSAPPAPRPAARRQREPSPPEPLSLKSRESRHVGRPRKIARSHDGSIGFRRATAPPESPAAQAGEHASADAPAAAAAVAAPDGAKAKGSGRRVKIMGRYVYGTELKPGEQWKRLLPWRR